MNRFGKIAEKVAGQLEIDAQGVVILRENELMPYFRRLERLVEVYEKHEQKTIDMPSAPDTSKFITLRYGFLRAVVNERLGDYYVLGLQVGSQFAVRPADINNEKEFHNAYNEGARIRNELYAKARMIVEPLRRKYDGYLKYWQKDGSAWSVWGLQIGPGSMNVI